MTDIILLKIIMSFYPYYPYSLRYTPHDIDTLTPIMTRTTSVQVLRHRSQLPGLEGLVYNHNLLLIAPSEDRESKHKSKEVPLKAHFVEVEYKLKSLLKVLLEDQESKHNLQFLEQQQKVLWEGRE